MRTLTNLEGPGDVDFGTVYGTEKAVLSYPVLHGWDYSEPLGGNGPSVKRPRQSSSSSTLAASEPIDIPQSPRDEPVWWNCPGSDRGRCIVGSYDPSVDTWPALMIKWETSLRRYSEQLTLQGIPSASDPRDDSDLDDSIHGGGAEPSDSITDDDIFEMDLDTWDEA